MPAENGHLLRGEEPAFKALEIFLRGGLTMRQTKNIQDDFLNISSHR